MTDFARESLSSTWYCPSISRKITLRTSNRRNTQGVSLYLPQTKRDGSTIRAPFLPRTLTPFRKP